MRIVMNTEVVVSVHATAELPPSPKESVVVTKNRETNEEVPKIQETQGHNSPETGEESVLLFLYLVAAITGTVIGVLKKKKVI